MPHNCRMLQLTTPKPIAMHHRFRRLGRTIVLAAGLSALLAGCADTRYYWQSVNGHLQLMQASRPVTRWLEDPDAPLPLKQQLVLSQRIRDFAVTELALPDNASYRRYADLRRTAVVWNVVAAPELSLKLKTWCFPLLGCVAYRGYFNEADARREAQELKAQGLEVTVYGVPAYSTLGWMNWAGGDPLLNTFIKYPEGELARVLFHELAHQVLYARDDTMFNESFATAVERIGGPMWLAGPGSDGARAQFAQFDARRREFRSLVVATRSALQAIYDSSATVDADRLRAQKAVVMQEFHDRYAVLKQGWGGYSGYDNWVAGANNASLGAQAAYDELVPQFEALFQRQGRDWPAFYDAVKRIADLPAAERRRALAEAAK